MNKQSIIKQAFREIYSVERTMEGAARFLGFYEVFSKYQIREGLQNFMIVAARACLRDRDCDLYIYGTLEQRLAHFKRTGSVSCFKNY